MKALVLLPFLSGCWLGNDFSRFEHGDAGMSARADLAMQDLAGSDLSAVEDGGMSGDAGSAADGDVADMPPPDMAPACPTELSWVDTGLSSLPVSATLVTISNRLFLVGGCRVTLNGDCGTPNDEVYEVTVDAQTGAVSTIDTTQSIGATEISAAAVALPPQQVGSPATTFGVFGSSTSVEEYDVTPTPSPTVVANARAPFVSASTLSDVAATSVSGLAWSVGGTDSTVKGPTGATYYLAGGSPSWTPGSHHLNVPRSSAGVAAFPPGLELWAIGGYRASNQLLASVETNASPTSAAWTNDGSVHLNTARATHAALLAPDGRIYVIGGIANVLNQIGPTSNVEVTCSRAFQSMTATLSSAISNVSASIGPDGRIYAIGTKADASAALLAYGPRANISMSFHVTGTGFAPSATVVVSTKADFSDIAGSAMSDSAGGLSLVLSGVVPAGGASLYAKDSKSGYPVRMVVPAPTPP